jgi:hypothetical protein
LSVLVDAGSQETHDGAALGWAGVRRPQGLYALNEAVMRRRRVRGDIQPPPESPGADDRPGADD